MSSQDEASDKESSNDSSEGGQLSALTRHWLRAQPAVAAYISASVWNYQDREDLVQEVAEVCAKKFSQFDESRSFMSWALGIARYEVLRYYRKQDSQQLVFSPVMLERVAEEVVTREPELENRFAALRECMKKVVGRPHQLLELRYYRGMKAEEIADRLGLTAGAVRVALCRVRQELSNCVGRQLRSREHAND